MCRLWLAVVGAVLLSAGPVLAGGTLRLSVQKTGTVAWELDVVRAHRLAEEQDLTIETTELASPEAGKVALRGGSADIVVSDWLWVSRERKLGAKLVFYPYSSALGAVMVPAGSPIKDLADLRGKRLGVAGGAVDKSWLLLRAALARDGIDLASEAAIIYGSPALLVEEILQGRIDATLNYWNFCADLEARGFRRVSGIEDILPRLGAKGRPAMVGYVFDESWAEKSRDVVTRFLEVTNKANEILATSDREWDRIAPLIGARDAATLKVYRNRYREGIPRRSVGDEEADARILYRVLAALGGSRLVGPAAELDPGTFYHGLAGN